MQARRFLFTVCVALYSFAEFNHQLIIVLRPTGLHMLRCYPVLFKELHNRKQRKMQVNTDFFKHRATVEIFSNSAFRRPLGGVRHPTESRIPCLSQFSYKLRIEP